MSIAFARCQFIQRSRGNSATRVAAYNARTVIVDDRTGERHDFTRLKDDLLHHEIMLPAGADPDLGRPAIISNMSESAERRKDARVGREFIWALPNELNAEDRLALARSFVKEHFTDKGLPFQLDIHGDHAHGWTPMRRLEGDRLAQKQAVELLPTIRTSPYGTFVAEANRWGQLWRIHQERREYHLRVDPVAIHPEKRSYGPRRSWGPDPDNSRAAQLIAERQKRNQKAARDPELVWEFAKQQKFDARALNSFLEKQLHDPVEQQHVAERVYELRDKDLHAAHVDSWWRPLQVEDLAPASTATIELGIDRKKYTYADLVKKEAELRQQLGKLKGSIKGRENSATAAEARAENRWREMDVVAKTMHLVGKATGITGLQDVEISDYESRWRRSQNTRTTITFTGDKRITDWGTPVHREHIIDRIDAIKKAQAELLKTIRPTLVPELERLREIEQTARQTLVNHQPDVILTQKQRHTLRSGP